jgi:hypothetical protein
MCLTCSVIFHGHEFPLTSGSHYLQRPRRYHEMVRQHRLRKMLGPALNKSRKQIRIQYQK